MVATSDVIVIGGGIIGMSIAWELSRGGARVTVLEAGAIGGEASWAGAGMLAPGGEAEGPSEWASLAVESLRMYPDFVAALESESGLVIDYRQSGALESTAGTRACRVETHLDSRAGDNDEWQSLLARAERQRQAGIASTVVDENTLFYPDDAVVNPRDLVQALRLANERRGVRIIEGERAIAIECEPGVSVRTCGSRYSAKACVLAAGAWSDSVSVRAQGEPHPLPRSFPVRGHLVGFDLPPGSLGPIVRSGHTYILQRANGFTIAGSSTEHVGFDRQIDAEIVADIVSRAQSLVPRLALQSPSTAWIGFRPGTDTQAPHIGRAGGTSLWLAYGHYRNGILLSPATARRIAADLLKASSETGSAGPTVCR